MTLLNMSLGGGVLIGVILVLRRALLHRVPKWTFLLLWGAALCRLLLPVALPSPVSIYTGAAWAVQALAPEEPSAPTVPTPAEPAPVVPQPPALLPVPRPEADLSVHPAPVRPEPEAAPAPAAVLYATGAALCGLFFGTAWLWSLRRFWDAVPAKGDFLRRWQEEHTGLLPVQIRVSRAVRAPLAYGLLRPVVLLPESTDWADEDQLTCVLTHEYIHIRRGDLLWKLLLAAALCVHWCNPLVWAMYFCANRDLELACDEAAVRILGLNSRKRYACALLAAAERGFFPLCTTYVSKNHMEERIRAVMKMKKQSLAAVLAALTLTAGVTAVFATSKAPLDVDKLPSAVQTSQGSAVPGDKSNPDDTRVHPVAPGDTSTPAGDRIHPITDQPAGTPADASQEPAPEKPAPEPEKQSAYPVNSKGQTYGLCSIVSPENCIPDLINVPFIKDGENDPSVVCYVRREDAAPYRYPGEIHNPDDAMDYMAWLEKQPYSVALPAYDKEGNSLGTTELIVNNSVQVDTGGKDLATIREEVKNNRWNVPADPIPEGTEFTVATVDEMNELCDYLHNVRGIKNADIAVTRHKDGSCTVSVAYYMTKQEEEAKKRLANGYPVNSKGQTYGFALDSQFVGEHPDLVAVEATNGKSGYILWGEYRYLGYTGRTETAEDMMAFIAWQETQPDLRVIPVYDVNRDNLIGYYEINLSNDEEFSEDELKWLEDGLRRSGIKEEDIAREIEKHRAPKS